MMVNGPSVGNLAGSRAQILARGADRGINSAGGPGDQPKRDRFTEPIARLSRSRNASRFLINCPRIAEASGKEADPSRIVLAGNVAAGNADGNHGQVGAQLVRCVDGEAELITGGDGSSEGRLSQFR